MGFNDFPKENGKGALLSRLQYTPQRRLKKMTKKHSFQDLTQRKFRISMLLSPEMTEYHGIFASLPFFSIDDPLHLKATDHFI